MLEISKKNLGARGGGEPAPAGEGVKGQHLTQSQGRDTGKGARRLSRGWGGGRVLGGGGHSFSGVSERAAQNLDEHVRGGEK